MKKSIIFLIVLEFLLSGCSIQDKESATRDFNKLYDKLSKIENNINASLDKSAEKTTGVLSDQLQKKQDEEKSKAEALTADIAQIKTELRSQKINQANHMQTSLGLQASIQEVNAKIEEYSNGVALVSQRLDSIDTRINQLSELYKAFADKNLSDTETAKNENSRWHTVGNSVVTLQAEIAELKVLTDALITNIESIKDPSLKKNIDKKKVTLSGKATLPEPVTSFVPADIEVPESKPASGDLAADENGPKVSISPEEVYKIAYAAYLKGNFELAISEFNDFLIKFPNSELALNTRYWIGECHYAKGDFIKSIQTFTELNQKHPKSIKAPSANLKIAYSYFNLNKKDEAVKALNDLIKEYPNSGEAELGKDKLKQIEKKP